jgi:Zn-dependent protease with chaperone function
MGERLVERLLAADRLEPRLTPARVGAYAVATFVHLLALALAVVGIGLIVLAFPNAFAIVTGLIAVGIAFLMRPRLGKPPEEDVLERPQAPTSYALADDVARSLAVAPMDAIVTTPEFNASWAVLGARRQRVLTIGLPLFAILEPQERVALIAHELAHARNGDATRGLVVGSAVRSLAEFYWVIGPEDFGGAREWGELAILERVVNLLLWLLSRPVLALLLLQLHLVLRDSQRAEFLADALAAKVAGTRATISLHEKLFLESTVWDAMRQAAHVRDGEALLFARIRSLARDVPERERERRRRTARLEDARLDATHPPTAHRIRLLEARPQSEPDVTLDGDTSAHIDAELAAREMEAESTLVDTYRESLYAG